MTHQTYLKQTGPDEGEIRCHACGMRVAVQMRDGKVMTTPGVRPYIRVKHGPQDVQHSIAVGPIQMGAPTIKDK